MVNERSCDRCGQSMEEVGSEYVPARETPVLRLVSARGRVGSQSGVP